MFGALLFAFSLEGLLPASVVPRRPVPVVRFDRVREPRRVRNLRRLAALLTREAWGEGRAAHATTDLRTGSRTVGVSPSWNGVVFVE